MKWAYGITTVPGRPTLPGTIQSLAAGGFDAPRLFVDGEGGDYSGFEVTRHVPPLRPFGNWLLALWELYIRNPSARRFAIFQDDVLCYRNLRQYLETQVLKPNTYWNLVTQLGNEAMVQNKPVGWMESGLLGYSSVKQCGLGALGLVFSREAALTLLSAPTIAIKPACVEYGHRKIDGAVVEAMNRADFREYIHNPTLLYHTGHISTMGNTGLFREAWTWRGEDFDALKLAAER